MDIYEGYNYRINIVGADSTIMVDSNTGLVKASISDVDENIIVDIYTNTLYGTLVGNIVNQDLELILDIDNKELSVTSILAEFYKGNICNSQNLLMYDSIENNIFVDGIVTKTLISDSITATSYKGNIYNMHNAIVYDSNHNSITVNLVNTSMIAADSIVATSYKGNIYNMHNAVVYDAIQNNIVVSNIVTNVLTSDNIKTGDLSATLINGNLVDYKKNLVLDTNSRTFHGHLFIEELSVGKEINANAIELYTGSGGINVYNHHEATNSIEDNCNSMTFSNARISNSQLDNTRPGDRLSYFMTRGYYNNDYRDAGGFYFTADVDKTKYHDNLESIPTIFGVYICNGTMPLDDKDDILSKSFTYNSSGVLNSPIIKTGSHKTEIPNPEKGMIIFNDTIGKFQGYTGVIWVDLH